LGAKSNLWLGIFINYCSYHFGWYYLINGFNYIQSEC